MAYFDVRLEIDEAAFKQDLLAHVAKAFSLAAVAAKPRMVTRIGEIIEQAVMASPEAASLQGGDLQGELGVQNPIRAIRAIIEALKRSIIVTPAPFVSDGAGLRGGPTISVMPSSMKDLLSLPEASFLSNGYVVAWLDWLLTKGDQVVIADWHFWPGDFAESRTGLGIMEPTKSWRVPSEFSGTSTGNWLIRAIRTIRQEFKQIVHEEFVRGIG